MGQQDFLNYPKGRVALDGGDLIDVYDVSLPAEDGEKIVATLRANPAGSTGGTRSVLLTFKCAISEAGYERDFWGRWKARKVVQVRLKVPGKTHTVTGRFTKPQVMTNVDNFIDFQISVLGGVD